MSATASAFRLERAAVRLVALHSYAVGLMLLFFPAWTLAFAGWGQVDELFFPRQSGIFHVLLATGYLVEHARHRTVILLVTAKVAAVLFLIPMTMGGGMAWAVPFSGSADGLMGVVVLLLHRRTRRLERP